MDETHLPSETELLVVGAGPYGLGVAAYARTLGLDPVIVGRPMAFWREQMPAGMLLRSSWDWHYDPNGVHTIEAWLDETGRTKADIDPFPLADYLEYATWFEVVSGLAPVDLPIQRIDLRPDGRFDAVFVDGETVIGPQCRAGARVRAFCLCSGGDRGGVARRACRRTRSISSIFRMRRGKRFAIDRRPAERL